KPKSRKCDKYPGMTCSRTNRSICPNTYNCNKKTGNCCKHKDFPRDCQPEVNKTTGVPYRCKGLGSKSCENGYVCVGEPRRRYSMCCKDFPCYDSSGNIHRKYEGKWKDPDGCSVCTCVSQNFSQCDDSACANTCGEFSDFSPCPLSYGLAICGKRAQIRKCRNAKNDLVSQRNAELNVTFCLPHPPAQCPEPGVPLTYSGSMLPGNEVKPKFRYGWIAHIAYDNKTHCSGTILSQSHILTAANCFFAKSGSKMLMPDIRDNMGVKTEVTGHLNPKSSQPSPTQPQVKSTPSQVNPSKTQPQVNSTL
ncbi:unnamed protein product, partial [Owenia fusiformis]